MDAVTIFAELAAILTGIITPILYRRVRGGPWHFAGDGYFLESMGFLLSILIANPVGLLVGIALLPLLPHSDLAYYAALGILNLALGILGGWVWIGVFLKPGSPSKTTSSRVS